MERISNTSWFIEDNKVVKLCDPTVFKNARTILPMDRVRDFFYDKKLKPGEEVLQNIEFMNEPCEFRIKRILSRDQKNPSTFLVWRSNIVNSYIKNLENTSKYLFKEIEGKIEIKDYTRMEFTKDKDGFIKLEVINKSNSSSYIFKKDIDKSTLTSGITIPKASVVKFSENTSSKIIERGQSQEITLILNNNNFNCRLYNPDRKGTPYEVLQIRYDSNKELRGYLMDHFGYIDENLDNAKVESKGYLEFYSTEKENTFLVKTSKEEETLTSNEVVLNTLNYIQNQGFNYTQQQISNLYLSLKTKPFLILAGISGTGKSKIARLLSEAIGSSERFNLISIRPDWNDNTDLIGYNNLNDQFIEGKLTTIIKQAEQNKNKPYIVCLDEMNLARVEYYLSDYLSVIESRKHTDGEITTDNIINNISIPENLYIIGTVNMDDTTFQFSRKVLDRANTIEFSDVDLENLFIESIEESEPLDLNNDFLKTTYLKTNDIEEEYRDYAKTVNTKIININEILKKAQKQFAYRVRDEILFYMVENKKADLLDQDLAFDYQIMQKILPAISGSEASIGQVLIDLFNFIADKTVITDDQDLEEATKLLQSNSIKYINSANKIIYMLKGYQNDGYVSYWY